MENYPTLEQIKKARERLGTLIQKTPAHLWTDPWLTELVGKDTEVFVKLELLQVTGTFKPRGALNVMLNLSPSKLKQGVTAVSAGNHAIATAYAAKALGTSAKVVMTKTARISMPQPAVHPSDHQLNLSGLMEGTTRSPRGRRRVRESRVSWPYQSVGPGWKTAIGTIRKWWREFLLDLLPHRR